MSIFDHECLHRTPQQSLEVDFTLPKSGWIWCRVKPLHDLYALDCTDIWDPFGDMINWLEEIADDSKAASWCISHEGHCSRLQFFGGNASIDDRSDYLFHVQTSGSIDRVRGVRVDRCQLVASFYGAFRAMADDPAYSPREWDRHPHLQLIEELDEEAFDTEWAKQPYGGLPLRTLRSPVIEAWLNEMWDSDRQLPLFPERHGLHERI